MKKISSIIAFREIDIEGGYEDTSLQPKSQHTLNQYDAKNVSNR